MLACEHFTWVILMSSPGLLPPAANPFSSESKDYQLIAVAAPARPPTASPQKINKQSQARQELCKRISLVAAFIAGGIYGTQYFNTQTEIILNMVFAGCVSAASPFPRNRSLLTQALGLSILWSSVMGGAALYKDHSGIASAIMVLGEITGTGFAIWPLILVCHRYGQGKSALSNVSIGMASSKGSAPITLDSLSSGVVAHGEVYDAVY